MLLLILPFFLKIWNTVAPHTLYNGRDKFKRIDPTGHSIDIRRRVV